MCFYITKKYTRADKAEKDIPVRKLVRPSELQEGVYFSWHKNFEYEDGYEYSNSDFSNMAKNYRNTGYGDRIGEGQGLHSFGPRTNVFVGFGQIEINCYIPKGARYFYNRKHGEYFSNKLVIVGKKKIKSK